MKRSILYTNLQTHICICLSGKQLAETKKALTFANDKIRTLQESISDANTTAKCAVGDLLALRETSTEKEQRLSEQCSEASARIAHIQAELAKTTAELTDVLHANEGLSSHLGATEDALVEEKEGRDKDRAALVAALNGIDDLTAQVQSPVITKRLGNIYVCSQYWRGFRIFHDAIRSFLEPVIPANKFTELNKSINIT